MPVTTGNGYSHIVLMYKYASKTFRMDAVHGVPLKFSILKNAKQKVGDGQGGMKEGYRTGGC